MPGDIDDVVDARHHPPVAVTVDIARVTSEVIAGVAREVGVAKTLGVIPQRAERARRQPRTFGAARLLFVARAHLHLGLSLVGDGLRDALEDGADELLDDHVRRDAVDEELVDARAAEEEGGRGLLLADLDGEEEDEIDPYSRFFKISRRDALPGSPPASVIIIYSYFSC